MIYPSAQSRSIIAALLHPAYTGEESYDRKEKHQSGPAVISGRSRRTEDRQEVGCVSHAVSCGRIVIFRGKILTLYKNYRGRYEGWVLPKGTVEEGETYEETALREVHEETGARPVIMKYIGSSSYSFNVREGTIDKDVYWYLMMADSYYSRPQREEYFEDSGYYKYHEAWHLLRFANEKEILAKGYQEYTKLRKAGLWVPGSSAQRENPVSGNVRTANKEYTQNS